MSKSKDEYPKGIMEQIQKLIAPPVSRREAAKKKPVPSHKYYKKPGKQHNKDYCYTCDEGGSLICCDVCPLSFHLSCLDPPMEEDEIPEGEWLCKACTALKIKNNKKEDQPISRAKKRKLNTTSKVGPKSRLEQPKPSTSYCKSESKLRNEEPKPSTSYSKSEPRASCENVNIVIEESEGEDGEKASFSDSEKLEILSIRKAWNSLIEAAKNKNPKAYECDKQYCTIPYHFPGDKKVIQKGRKANRNHNGPVPSKICFYCHRGCSYQPLLFCDYCPNAFHLDCLDPPLTIAPKTYWMCPLHIEPFLEEKFFKNGATISQRVALWDFLRQPMDQEAIKLEFFRKVSAEREPHFPSVNRGIKIPDYVIGSYKSRPHMIPSLKSALRLDNYEKSLTAVRDMGKLARGFYQEKQEIHFPEKVAGISEMVIPPEKKATREEQELWLESFLQLQKNFALEITKQAFSNNCTEDLSFERIIDKYDSSNTSEPKEKSEANVTKKVDKPVTEVEVICVDSVETKIDSAQASCSKSSKELKIGSTKTRPGQTLDIIIMKAINSIPESEEALNILSNLDPSIKNLLAFQRVCQIINFKNIKSLAARGNIETAEIIDTVVLDESDSEGIEEMNTGKSFENLLEVCQSIVDTCDDEGVSNIESKKDTIMVHAEIHSDMPQEESTIISLDEDDIVEINSKIPDDKSVKNQSDKQKIETSNKNPPYSPKPSTSREGEPTFHEDKPTSHEGKPTSHEGKPTSSETDAVTTVFKTQLGLYVVSGDYCFPVDEEDFKQMVISGEAKVESYEDLSSQLNVLKIKPVTAESEGGCYTAEHGFSGKPVAALCSLDNEKDWIKITRSNVKVGLDAEVDIDLSKYGHCNYTSSMHAIIFYDKCNLRFEILNYSRFGTRVDNILMSVGKPAVEREKCICPETCATHKAKTLISSTLRNKEKSKEKVDQQLRKLKFDSNPCKCDFFLKEEELTQNGYEGPVPLQHGSMLQFGCLRFVFSDISLFGGREINN